MYRLCISVYTCQVRKKLALGFSRHLNHLSTNRVVLLSVIVNYYSHLSVDEWKVLMLGVQSSVWGFYFFSLIDLDGSCLAMAEIFVNRLDKFLLYHILP